MGDPEVLGMVKGYLYFDVVQNDLFQRIPWIPWSKVPLTTKKPSPGPVVSPAPGLLGMMLGF